MDESREDHRTAESDRLSELPDSLLLSILSLMEMKDVVRTTILSKRWKDLWTTVPYLDFCDAKRCFTHGALAKWKGAKILKFTIFFFSDKPPTSHILDSWLLIPIDKQVEELYVYLGPDIDPEYCAPQPLYSCFSITKLILSDCDVKIEENVNVQWNQLRSLTIEHQSYLSEDAMNRIISGAPLLEELMLLSLDICENLNIQSTSLKMLKIGRDIKGSDIRTVVMANTMLRIWAPNLLTLEISAYVYATCLLDVPSLTNAILCFEELCDIYGEMIDEELPPLEMFDQVFRSISHAEKVTLSDLSIELLLYMEENDTVVQFSNTKFLKLCIYAAELEGMLDILEMFPKLMTLVVELNEECRYTLKSEKSEVEVLESLMSKATYLSPSLHQLKTVEISWCTCNASIFPVIEILLQNARLLDKMVFRPKWSYEHIRCDRKLWLKAKEKVLSMPKSSPTAKVIVLMSSLGGECF